MHDAPIHEPTSGGGMALRLFAALPVAGELATQLAEHADVAGFGVQGVRPVRADAMHVTFAFLGDVPEELVPIVATALDAAAASVPGPTACTLTDICELSDGHVRAAGVELDLLASLAAARDQFLAAMAPYAPHADRRSWHPHVSLLRARDAWELSNRMTAMPMPHGSWVAPSIGLFASIPGPGGQFHRSIHVSSLGGVDVHAPLG